MWPQRLPCLCQLHVLTAMAANATSRLRYGRQCHVLRPTTTATQTVAGARGFFDRRAAFLKEKIELLQPQVVGKVKMKRMVEEV